MVMQMKGRGLPTLVQFVWIKQLRYIKYAVAHAQCLRPNVEVEDRKFKAMQESFDKTTDITWLSVINTKYALLCNECLFSPRSHDR